MTSAPGDVPNLAGAAFPVSSAFFEDVPGALSRYRGQPTYSSAAGDGRCQADALQSGQSRGQIIISLALISRKPDEPRDSVALHFDENVSGSSGHYEPAYQGHDGRPLASSRSELRSYSFEMDGIARHVAGEDRGEAADGGMTCPAVGRLNQF